MAGRQPRRCVGDGASAGARKTTRATPDALPPSAAGGRRRCGGSRGGSAGVGHLELLADRERAQLARGLSARSWPSVMWYLPAIVDMRVAFADVIVDVLRLGAMAGGGDRVAGDGLRVTQHAGVHAQRDDREERRPAARSAPRSAARQARRGAGAAGRRAPAPAARVAARRASHERRRARPGWDAPRLPAGPPRQHRGRLLVGRPAGRIERRPPRRAAARAAEAPRDRVRPSSPAGGHRRR